MKAVERAGGRTGGGEKGVDLGTAQAAVYQEHLCHRPLAAAATPHRPVNRLASMGMQITNLRLAALCPDSPALAAVVSHARPGGKRSWTPWTPKLAAILSLVSSLLDEGEQVLIGSPFTRFSTVLHGLLTDAGVDALLLDGSVPPAIRGELAGTFKRGEASVLIAGLASMSRGHSFSNCSHLVLAAYSWALDEVLQFIHRVWRLDSPKPVTIWLVTADGTIDVRMAESVGDKTDASHLVLDGRFCPVTVEDTDPAQLLAETAELFHRSATAGRIDEATLEAAWPALRKRLGWSRLRYAEWHPPIIPLPGLAATDIATATTGTAIDPLFDFAVAKERFKQNLLRNQRRLLE